MKADDLFMNTIRNRRVQEYAYAHTHTYTKSVNNFLDFNY